MLSAKMLYGIHWPIYPCKNGSRVTSPTTWKFCRNWPIPFNNADVLSIFAHEVSAVTISEKSSINANRRSSMGFPMSLRWTMLPLQCCP